MSSISMEAALNYTEYYEGVLDPDLNWLNFDTDNDLIDHQQQQEIVVTPTALSPSPWIHAWRPPSGLSAVSDRTASPSMSPYTHERRLQLPTQAEMQQQYTQTQPQTQSQSCHIPPAMQILPPASFPQGHSRSSSYQSETESSTSSDTYPVNSSNTNTSTTQKRKSKRRKSSTTSSGHTSTTSSTSPPASPPVGAHNPVATTQTASAANVSTIITTQTCNSLEASFSPHFFEMITSYLMVVLNIMKGDIVDATVSSSSPFYLLAHLLRNVNIEKIRNLLKQLGYTTTTTQHTQQINSSSTDNAVNSTGSTSVVWRASNPFLPHITLPSNVRMSWSLSPDVAFDQPFNVLSFPTLIWRRPVQLVFTKKGNRVLAIDADDKRALESIPPSALLPPSSVNLSDVELPNIVEVNTAFERLFGWTQQEIKTSFIREDTRAVMRLMDEDSIRRMLDYDGESIKRGQMDAVQYVNIQTKYAGTLKAILHTKRVIIGTALERKIYVWVTLPVENKALEKTETQQQHSGGSTAAAFVPSSGSTNTM